ncbi:protein Aster-B-like [Amphiura filiformis]|uniref:protein Aster-B-like n=1 Tax=Amphiura filiformis TaxID=82378 RepID=UPI003B214761
MALRPNRLPTSLRDRTLITTSDSTTRNNINAQSLGQSGQFSGSSADTCTSGGGVSTVNSASSYEGEPKSEFDKNFVKSANQHSSPNGVAQLVGTNVAHQSSINSSKKSPLATNSNSRTSPSPNPSPAASPGLNARSSNSTPRTSSPKLVVKAALTDDEAKSDIQNWVQDGLNNLTSSNQNRLSLPGSGTAFTRISSLPTALTTLSDSGESSLNSSKSSGSMDGKDDKDGKRSSKDISKDLETIRVSLPENDNSQKSTASDENSNSTKGQNNFHHSASSPNFLAQDEAAHNTGSPGSGGATPSSSQLSASPGSDSNNKLSPKDAALKNKRKSAPWLSTVLSSSYKTKCEEFKKTFKNIPVNERLVVDYSCALQKDILVQGRMYVTEEWLCFYANIFKWETLLTIKLKEITAITKERTIRFIPNAIQITTEGEKYFFTSFMSRDKTYMLLFRVWQNALIGQKMSPDEYWTRVHGNYGSNLGLASDEIPEDYVKPSLENGDDSLDEEYKDDTVEDGDDEIFLHDEESQDLSYSEGSVSMSISSATGPDSPGGLDNNIIARPVPQGVTAPDVEDLGEVQSLCQEEFDGREYFNMVYDVPVDKMAEALFADGHSFLKDFMVERGHSDIDITQWEKADDNCDSRKISYTYNLANAIGPKSCGIVEVHTMRKDWCQQGHSYVNDLDVRQKGVPYCDYFYSCARQTLTRVSSTSCRLRVQCSLIYIKNAWGFVKNFIEKNTDSATKETYKVMDTFIREQVVGTTYPVHIKKRKPRKRRATLPSKDESEKRPEKRKSEGHVEGTEVFWLARAANRVLPSWVQSRVEFLGDTRNLMLIVCFVLILLSLFNMSLFLHLRSLEDKAGHRPIWSPEEMAAKLNELPKTSEEWSVLLQQQQYYHELELNKWKDVVGLCIQLIKQMESTLSELHSGLHPLKSMTDIDELKKAMKGQGSGEL